MNNILLKKFLVSGYGRGFIDNFDQKSFTKYLRKTLVLCEIAHYLKRSISVFQEIILLGP